MWGVALTIMEEMCNGGWLLEKSAHLLLLRKVLHWIG